ncbi:MAG: SGNH/GDSL hydrolase family protein [Clostridiaceae bacterium]|nr:SGNH/GDSL hydrolase family protein [Clostridiaceae bacterium]
MKMRKIMAALLAALCAAGGTAEAAAAAPTVPTVTASPVEAVNVPFTLTGHAVDSGKNNGRSYFYIVIAEQVREVPGVEVTFTREGFHQIWAIGSNGRTIPISNGACGKGTYQIPVTKEMVRLEFDLFTEEIPFLGLSVPGGMTVMKTPYAGRSLSILGDSLSEADNWKTAGNDPDAYNMTSQWWYAAAKEFGMNLLVNNSVGGSGVYEEAAQKKGSGGLQRCMSLHTAAREPDEIFVLLGANDILRGRTPQSIAAGYQQMVQDMQKRYPKAEIVLFTYPYFGSVESFQKYKSKVDSLNMAIRTTAKNCGIKLVELAGCPFTAENIRQYLRSPADIHFNRAGQALIGPAAVKGLYILAAEAAMQGAR